MVKAGPCAVTQVKNLKKDGYCAIRIGYSDLKPSKVNKAMTGHFSKSNSTPKKVFKEFRVKSDGNSPELGDLVDINQFTVGDFVKVTGFSIGKGFAGHMKRHGFSGGRASHGKNSVMRKAGSIGAGSDPSRVWKGTRMAGRMGFDNVSIKNLAVVRIDASNNLIYLRGSVPGSNKGLVFITK